MAVESPSVAPRRLLPLLVTATCLTLALTLLTGVVYPAAVLLLSRLFPSEAAGSPLRRGEVVVGSALVGQGFAGPTYFHGRPSAAGSGYDGASSGGTNLGPLHPRLVDGTPDDPTTAGVDEAFAGVRALADAYRRDNGLPAGAPVPADAVTRSASGLDPHITPENAALQVPRVARRRGVDEARVRALVAAHTEGRTLGFLGEPRVAVLPLNLALDRFFPLAPGTR